VSGRNRSVIESDAAYHVCGEARDGIDAVHKVRQSRPDIVLMDIQYASDGRLAGN